MKGRGGEKKKDPVAMGPETEPYDALADIAQMLKRSPIVIFSKTYCSYSRCAKDMLFKQYKITPPPFVVELDEHEHGVELQAALAKQTGRGTVPNVMISGKSIGGCDDVVALEKEGMLVEKIQKMGGKRIMEILKLQV